tara:strand:- start:155 stop:508 length:354 start_codon:yes stop_codon:yes gene_type:complete
VKLEDFLDAHGEFPSRYRPLIWRFLLQLPENMDAYENVQLSSTGTSVSAMAAINAYVDLETTYPLRDGIALDKLKTICTRMASWAPVLQECSYLPTLMFPLTVVYGGDDMAALETGT